MCFIFADIHSEKILHRDLKTMNLFLDKEGRIKIGPRPRSINAPALMPPWAFFLDSHSDQGSDFFFMRPFMHRGLGGCQGAWQREIRAHDGGHALLPEPGALRR